MISLEGCGEAGSNLPSDPSHLDGILAALIEGEILDIDVLVFRLETIMSGKWFPGVEKLFDAAIIAQHLAHSKAIRDAYRTVLAVIRKRQSEEPEPEEPEETEGACGDD